MRKILYVLITLCVSILLVSHVFALGYNMSLTGDDTIDKSITLDLVMDSLEEIKGFYGLTATLEYDTNLLELTSISGQNNFNLTHNEKTNKIVLYNPNGISEKTTIMTLKFKNKTTKEGENINVSLTNITASNGDKDIKVNNINKVLKNINTSKIAEDNAYLSDIKINGKNLELTDNTLNYDIVVANDIKEIKISANGIDDNVSVTGNGSYILNDGENEIDITVTSPNGLSRDYKINVFREDENSSGDDDNLFIKSSNQNNNHNYLLYIIPLVLVVLLFMVILIIKKRKDKR